MSQNSSYIDLDHNYKECTHTSAKTKIITTSIYTHLDWVSCVSNTRQKHFTKWCGPDIYLFKAS